MSIRAPGLSRAARKAETRRALVDAASELFAGQGIEGTSLDEVAARVGLTKGAVYAHFPNKSALVEEVLEAVSEVVDPKMIVDSRLSLAERLTGLGREAVKIIHRIPRRTVLLDLEYALYVLRDPDRSRKYRRDVRRHRALGDAEFTDSVRERNEELPVPGRELQALLQAVGRGIVLELAHDPQAITDETILRFFAALGHGLDDVESVNELLSTRSNR